ncbi:uncharacterized protein LOC121754558 [Salvia splendens]|uniref:uncharacterized protein LOC121754558 n=1 Tax=Salvia splendens TaxID=180675 RepID=UPI001C254CA0|nr:uncharacterized protein LOC121754558 [Salvia splendens]
MQPPGHENISEVSLRSGKVYQSPSHPAISPPTDFGPSREEEGESSRGGQVEEKCKEKVGGEASEEGQKEETERVKPYPYRGMVTRKKDATIDVASTFKDVDVKRNDLPSKKTDPGMFTLPISIGDIQVEHAMYDLGASINVLPHSIYRKLGEVKLVDTDIMIQLADRSYDRTTAKELSGVLLGQPFLSTASNIIDVRNGTISLDFKGEQYTFNIDEAMKRPADGENVYSVDVTEPLVQEFLEEEFLNRQFTDSAVDEEVEKEVEEWFEKIRLEK